MAKDTKKLVINAVLNILHEGDILNMEAITRRTGVTRQTIQKNFGKKGIDGVFEYIYKKMLIELNERLFEHDPEELPLEIFCDIILKISWKYRKEWNILFSANRIYQALSLASDLSFHYVSDRYERLIKVHNLSPIVSPKAFHYLWNSHLLSVISLWLNVPYPVEPEIFKPKFLYLMRHSMDQLIYSKE